MSASPAGLPLVARYTWARQWPAFLCEGLGWGILSLAPFAAKRSLGAQPEIVPLLFALWQVPWILSPAVGPLFARTDPQKLWRRIAVAGYLPIALIALVSVVPVSGGEPGAGEGDLPLFVGLLSLHYLAAIGWTLHKGAMLRTNYDAAVRGRMFGFLTALFFIASACSARGAGALLDLDPRWLRVVYPVAAVAAGAGLLLQSRIRWRRQRSRHARAASPLGAWKAAFRVLGRDRAFLVYEAGFMLYGFGFLCSVPVIVLFAEEELGLSYGAFTTASAVAFPAAQIAASAYAGRLADRLGMERFTVVAFLLLACFMGTMNFVGTAAGLTAAYALFGMAMAGVNVAWSLGPLHFAPDREGHMYTALHFSLVGVRSAIAPFVGYFVAARFGYRAAFSLSVVFLVLGAALVSRLVRRR